MRLDLTQHVASSCLAAFRLLQDVVDPKDLQAAPSQTANGVHPNLLGCVDSPEAATMVLLVVGMAGIYYGSSFYMRRMRRKQIPTSL